MRTSQTPRHRPLRGADFYVAHNCEFESSFFAAQGVELGPWICTYKCALRVWPELDGHSNQELRYALGRATPFPGFDRSTISPHRAAFDVVVTAAIFEELIKRARWSELVQWSGEPALYTKFHFGKYRGRRYDEVAASDPDYLRWIIDKSELETDIKHSARYWMAALGLHDLTEIFCYDFSVSMRRHQRIAQFICLSLTRPMSVPAPIQGDLEDTGQQCEPQTKPHGLVV